MKQHTFRPMITAAEGNPGMPFLYLDSNITGSGVSI
jgi:hypothetical protein